MKEILKSLDYTYILDEENLGINIFDDTIRFYIPNIDEDESSAKVEAVLIKIKNEN